MTLSLSKGIKQKRNVNIDLLRTICSICIVIMHIIDFYILSYHSVGMQFWTFINVFESIIRFAVPIFFMISGALLIKNFEERPLTFYKKRFTSIVIPYVTISIFYSLGNQILKTKTISLSIVSKNILRFDAHYHLWFFGPLITLYLFLPIIRKLIKFLEVSNKQFILNAYLIVWFVCSITLPFIINVTNLTSIKYISDIWGYLGYFILGYVLNNYCKEYLKSRYNTFKFFYILAVIATIIGNYIYLNKETGIYNNYFINPMSLNIFVESISLFIYFTNKSFNFNSKSSNAIRKIGMSSLYIYLFHPIFILFIKDILKINLFSGNLYFKCFFAITVVTIGTIIFSITLDSFINLLKPKKSINLEKSNKLIDAA